jgi:uncharacterized protein YybS (DUF2232 family)
VPLESERNHYELLMVYTLRSLIQLSDYSLYIFEPLFMGFRVLFILVFLGFPCLCRVGRGVPIFNHTRSLEFASSFRVCFLFGLFFV